MYTCYYYLVNKQSENYCEPSSFYNKYAYRFERADMGIKTSLKIAKAPEGPTFVSYHLSVFLFDYVSKLLCDANPPLLCEQKVFCPVSPEALFDSLSGEQ